MPGLEMSGVTALIESGSGVRRVRQTGTIHCGNRQLSQAHTETLNRQLKRTVEECR